MRWIKRMGQFKAIIVLGSVLFANHTAAAQCLRTSFSPGVLYKTTGNLVLDAKFNQEANMLSRVLGVNPNMYLFDDGYSPNAMAVPQTTLPGYSGTVLFGISLMRDELWSMHKGEVAVAGIMAHEFSHILQLKYGSRLQGKFRELHADFMAGYYLGRKGYISETALRGFAHSLFEKGDYNFRDPSHHGTPQERVRAMMAGYQSSRLGIEQAYLTGESFVRGVGSS